MKRSCQFGKAVFCCAMILFMLKYKIRENSSAVAFCRSLSLNDQKSVRHLDIPAIIHPNSEYMAKATGYV